MRASMARVDVAEKVWASSCDIRDIPPAVCFFMPNRERCLPHGNQRVPDATQPRHYGIPTQMGGRITMLRRPVV